MIAWYDYIEGEGRRLATSPLNDLIINDLIFHPFVVVSRGRDTQLQMGEKMYSDLFILRPNIL